jgi:hypothetical protein
MQHEMLWAERLGLGDKQTSLKCVGNQIGQPGGWAYLHQVYKNDIPLTNQKEDNMNPIANQTTDNCGQGAPAPRQHKPLGA